MSESAHEATSTEEQESEPKSATDSDGAGYNSADKEPGSDRGRGASDDELVERVESEGFDIERVDVDDRDHTEDDESEIEEERRRRLDPENRPENAEVDNTQRTFDTEKGVFEDSPEEARIDGDPTFSSEAESESDAESDSGGEESEAESEADADEDSDRDAGKESAGG
jgi:hypothetical protein